MNAARWSAEAVEAAAQVMFLRRNDGQWGSGLGLRAGGIPWGTGREAAQHEKYLNDASVVLEAVRPHLETMLIDAQEDALANHEPEVYCEERHYEQDDIDALLRAAEDAHYVDHEGPWPTCSTTLCRTIREAIG